MRNKKQAIIETGTQLFLNQGIVNTSMEQIAEQVPVAKMTIYNYFQSKEGLLEAVVNALIEETFRIFREVMDNARDPLDALERFSHAKSAFELEISDAFMQDLMLFFPGLLEKFVSLTRTQIMPEFEQMIFKGQQMGQIRKDVSPHLLIAFLNFMKQFVSRPDLYQGLGSMNAVTEQLTTILYYGIVAPSAKPGSIPSEGDPEDPNASR